MDALTIITGVGCLVTVGMILTFCLVKPKGEHDPDWRGTWWGDE